MKTLIKAYLKIDGEDYKALFEDVDDMETFMEGCRVFDHSIVILIEFYEVNAQDIIEDEDFEENYKIEMLAILLLPCDMRKGANIKTLERALMLEGVYPITREAIFEQ